MKTLTRLSIYVIGLVLMLNPAAFGQAAGGQQNTVMDESMRDVYIVTAAGATGAILGLSTLSFVETPSDHLKNIVVGGAIGIILGVGVVAYLQANKSKEMYMDGFGGGQKAMLVPAFDTGSRLSWHKGIFDEHSDKKTPQFSLSFNF